MSNFKCPHCGMTNIDCGKDGFKTQREIELEEALKKIKVIVNEPCVAESLTDCEHCEGNCEHKDILNIINKVYSYRMSLQYKEK